MKKIIVCEGLHDEIKIKSAFPGAKCIITNGSEIPLDTLNTIKTLSKTHEIIIFTDPDYPGERIRKKILDVVPNAKEAFIKKDLARSYNDKKIGVEHAKIEDIKSSLENLLSSYNEDKIFITLNELYDLGFAGEKNSSFLREKVSNFLNIGHPNFKTFFKRLNQLEIDKEKLIKIMEKLGIKKWIKKT